MRGTFVIHADSMKESPQRQIGERWVMARPEGRTGLFWRIKCAWKVFTGKADVLVWFNQ